MVHGPHRGGRPSGDRWGSAGSSEWNRGLLVHSRQVVLPSQAGEATQGVAVTQVVARFPATGRFLAGPTLRPGPWSSGGAPWVSEELPLASDTPDRVVVVPSGRPRPGIRPGRSVGSGPGCAGPRTRGRWNYLLPSSTPTPPGWPGSPPRDRTPMGSGNRPGGQRLPGLRGRTCWVR